MAARGRLITLEGIDGAGKSTLAAGLLAAHPELTLLREPGGVEVSERIRALVKDTSLAIAPRAEALLFAAARAQLVQERLQPLLAAGTDVLLDRFVDSSLAYQGAARGLGIEAVGAINEFATCGVRPDLTLYLRVDPEVGAARRFEGDRFEQSDATFFAEVTAAYDRIAGENPDRVHIIDASAPAEQVLADGLRIVNLALSGE